MSLTRAAIDRPSNPYGAQGRRIRTARSAAADRPRAPRPAGPARTAGCRDRSMLRSSAPPRRPREPSRWCCATTARLLGASGSPVGREPGQRRGGIASTSGRLRVRASSTASSPSARPLRHDRWPGWPGRAWPAPGRAGLRDVRDKMQRLGGVLQRVDRRVIQRAPVLATASRARPLLGVGVGGQLVQLLLDQRQRAVQGAGGDRRLARPQRQRRPGRSPARQRPRARRAGSSAIS